MLNNNIIISKPYAQYFTQNPKDNSGINFNYVLPCLTLKAHQNRYDAVHFPLRMFSTSSLELVDRSFRYCAMSFDVIYLYRYTLKLL